LEYRSNTECKTCKTGYSVNPSDKSQCLTCTASTRSYYLYIDDFTCRSECNYPYSPSQPSSLEKLCILNIDPSIIESAESLGKGANIGGILSTISGIIMSFADKTSPSSLTLISMTKMLQYMKFIDVNYPPKLFFMLRAQKLTSTGLNFIPAMSQSSKDDIENRSLPLKFDLNGVHSSFLVGFWQPFLSLIIIAFIILIISAFEYYFKDNQQVHNIAKKINSYLKWNVFLTIFCSNYSDLAFYTSVEFASIEFDTGVPVISFMICLAVNTLGFFIVVFMMKTIASLRLHINQQNITIFVTNRRVIRPIQDFRKPYMNYSMIFEDFKEQSWLQQSYVIIFCVRAYLHGLFVGFMYDVPVAQAVLLVILGVCILAYLIIKRPMKKLIDFIQQIFCETVLLVANFCVFIMAVVDSKIPGENSSKDGFGTLILGMNLVLNWSLPVFAVIKGVMIFMKARNKVGEKQKTLPPLETNMRNNVVIENSQNNRGIVTTNHQAIETFENSPTRIMPRIHLQTRSPIIPQTEFDISHYQITDNDTSMVELKRGQSQHSQLETRPVSMAYLGSGVIGGGRGTQNEIHY